jgi:hypothetical protein
MTAPLVPVHVRLRAQISSPTRKELDSLRESVLLALAQAQGDNNRRKFIPGLLAYRNAIDLLLAIQSPTHM